jgi:hypothetical protein
VLREKDRAGVLFESAFRGDSESAVSRKDLSHIRALVATPLQLINNLADPRDASSTQIHEVADPRDAAVACRKSHARFGIIGGPVGDIHERARAK